MGCAARIGRAPAQGQLDTLLTARLRTRKVPANRFFVYGQATDTAIESMHSDGIKQAATSHGDDRDHRAIQTPSAIGMQRHF
jgi:hypothetical protein